MQTRNDVLDTERLHRLIEVGRALLSELNLEALLDRLLATAVELTGARYAAIGVLNEERTELARFLTRGIDAEAHRAIGDLPRGRGVLGALIENPEPLRLHDVSADPRSYGFPAAHPPMHTFLGVPIAVRGEAWGNLYLTEKAGGEDFDEGDEASAVILADWAAIAVQNARLYETLAARGVELERAVRGFEATAAIARALGVETDLSRVLELVVKRGRALMEARSVIVLLVEGDELVVAAGAGQLADGGGARISVAGSTSGQVVVTQEARRVDDVEVELRIPAGRLGVPDASAALLVPLVYRRQALGVLAAFDRLADPPTFSRDDQQLLEAFAATAATAVAMARTVEEQRLRQSMASGEAERQRWARELHDETLQALGALKVMLASARRSEDVESVREALDGGIVEVEHSIQNLRALITELRPAALDQLGLVPALSTLVKRLSAIHGVEMELDAQLGDARLAADLETAVYRLVQEALANVVKHADATHAWVSIGERDGGLRIEIRDDGRGFDPGEASEGFGLIGMHERMALEGGRLEIEPLEPGTLVAAQLPLRRAAQS